MAVDFKKAFDSVDKKALIHALLKYERDPLVIEVITRLYTGDNTRLYLENTEIEEMEVTSGIRQGCTLSPLLFIMVLNKVIECLQNKS